MLVILMVLVGLGREAEVARVQLHLAGAEAQLRAAEVSAWSVEQRARRAEVIAELARYRRRGEFPRNLDHAARTPYFIDDRGVRCAMAHLIEVFGGASLVARVAATANNAYVRDLAGDPELIAWLVAHGLTVAEAARIQPGYTHEVGETCGSFNVECSSNVCIPAPDHPEETSYCSIACDPAADDCPVGMQGVQMTCQRIGDEDLCAYPGMTPGLTGWPCQLGGLAEPQCLIDCVADRETGEGTCAAACPEDACSNGLVCYAGWSACAAPQLDGGDGCSAGGDPPALALLSVLLLVCTRRARRRSA